MKTVSMLEIAQRVAPGAVENAQSVLDSALREIHSELCRGNTVDLPVPLVLSLDPNAAALPHEGVTQVLDIAAVEAAAQTYHIMYAVAEKDFFTNVTAQRLSGSRSRVTIVEGKDDTLVSVRQDRPDLIIIDSSMDDGHGLIREIKSDKETSLVATILTYPEGSDPDTYSGLKVCEDEKLIEPFEFNDLISLAQSELGRAIEERGFFQHEIHFQFQTTEQSIEEANDFLAHLVEQITEMSEESQAAFGVGFREAVDNSARHGNKNQERKVIDTIYLLDTEKVTVTVEDEGDGFDTEQYITRGKDGNAIAQARQRHQEGRVGGLGIMLMLKCLDDLQYNHVGNQIRLTKYIR